MGAVSLTVTREGRMAANVQRQAAAGHVVVACRTCGASFQQTHNRLTYCSRACALVAARPLRTRRERVAPVVRIASCRQCGRPFAQERGAIYCGDGCRVEGTRAHRREAYRAAYVPVGRSVLCTVCEQPFVRTGQGARSTCSDLCRATARRERDRDTKSRRRARKRGVGLGRVHRRRIFERDGWTCQICHRPLARARVAPHPMSPSIDHIVPLAAGGRHEPLNVQAAHLLCNSKKGDRGASQLRLLA